MKSFTEMPDLVVDQCPGGCNKCDKIYINVQTGHRIICKCKNCNHNEEKEVLARVVGPSASTFRFSKSSKEQGS
jgi:hypothetical protein